MDRSRARGFDSKVVLATLRESTKGARELQAMVRGEGPTAMGRNDVRSSILGF